jgi:rhomboid protease GluP
VALFNRRTTGSVVCPGCGALVGVKDPACYMCGRSNPGLFGYGPLLRQISAQFGFAQFVIVASSALYVISLLLSGSELEVAGGGMSFLAPSNRAVVLLGASGAYQVFVRSAWWTVLSATWLHGSFLHILFNMMWVRDLGPAVAELIGTSRTVVIYVVSGVVGFALSSVLPFSPIPIPFLHGAPLTLGASASIFGLLGALVHYGRKSGSSYTYSQAMRYAVILFVMGFVMRGVDNSAHLGGFVGGYLMSAAFNPMTRERGDHAIIALLSLAATFAAIVASVISGLSLFAG